IDWLVFGFLRATTLRLPQRPTLCGGRLSVIVTTSKRSASNARRLSTEKTVGSSGVGSPPVSTLTNTAPSSRRILQTSPSTAPGSGRGSSELRQITRSGQAGGKGGFSAL